MTSFNRIHVRAAAVSTIAAAALVGLAGCGPQSSATNSPPTAAAQQQPADTAYPGSNPGAAPLTPAASNYAANNGVPPQTARAGQAVPATNGYAAQPGAVPAQQAYAPPPPAQAYAPPTQVAQRVAPPAAPRAPNPALHGEVSGIEAIRSRPQGNGTGAVLGGVLGAVVGNQFGHGNGRTALTVLGAGGGAVAGNNVERNMSEKVTGYRVSVRLDNGQVRTYEESNLDGLRVGDRVRIDGHRVVRT